MRSFLFIIDHNHTVYCLQYIDIMNKSTSLLQYGVTLGSWIILRTFKGNDRDKSGLQHCNKAVDDDH